MTLAHTISTAFDTGYCNSTQALEAARAVGITDEDQFWKSETTVLTLTDGSKIAFSGPDVCEVVGRKREMLVELMEAKERGVTNIWYGNIENASPESVDDAIYDIRRMSEDAIGEGSWGEWDEITCPLPGTECDHDGGCDSCPRRQEDGNATH